MKRTTPQAREWGKIRGQLEVGEWGQGTPTLREFGASNDVWRALGCGARRASVYVEREEEAAADGICREGNTQAAAKRGWSNCERHSQPGASRSSVCSAGSKRWPALLSVGLLLLGSTATVLAQPICTDGVPCVVDKGSASFDNAEFVTTAVGCSETVNVKFGSALDSTTAPTVAMCERDVEGNCKYKSGVILNQFKRDCCAIAFVKRSRDCIAPTMADDPNGVFQCIQLSYTIEPGHVTAHITFFGSFGSDLVNGGQVEVCLTASHGNGTMSSSPYCILFVVQRCSVCLQPGEGLASVAKRYGTHWTQVYSANNDIKGNPDDLAVNQLVRLGNQYTVKAGDTLVALALKFGVSVNQIFFWNPHLVPLSDLGGKVFFPSLSVFTYAYTHTHTNTHTHTHILTHSVSLSLSLSLSLSPYSTAER